MIDYTGFRWEARYCGKERCIVDEESIDCYTSDNLGNKKMRCDKPIKAID